MPVGLAPASADFGVLVASAVAGRTIVAVQVYAGAPRVGLVLRVEGTAERWEVSGIGTVPLTALDAGRWGLSLRPIAHAGTLRADQRLVAA